MYLFYIVLSYLFYIVLSCMVLPAYVNKSYKENAEFVLYNHIQPQRTQTHHHYSTLCKHMDTIFTSLAHKYSLWAMSLYLSFV